MFNLTVYCRRTLNTIPPRAGSRDGSIPESATAAARRRSPVPVDRLDPVRGFFVLPAGLPSEVTP